MSNSRCLSVSIGALDKYLFSEKGTFTALSITKADGVHFAVCSGQKDIPPNSNRISPASAFSDKSVAISCSLGLIILNGLLIET